MDFIVLVFRVFFFIISFLYSKQILAAIISIEGATVLIIIKLLTLGESIGRYWPIFLLCAVATVGAAAGLRFVVKILKFNLKGYVI